MAFRIGRMCRNSSFYQPVKSVRFPLQPCRLWKGPLNGNFKAKVMTSCNLLPPKVLCVGMMTLVVVCNITPLQKAKKWDEIVAFGEQSLLNEMDDYKRFLIHDELVSAYFRLGNFQKAIEHAKALSALVLNNEKLKEPQKVINSLYKNSAALRGVASSSFSMDERRMLFAEANSLCAKAYELCETFCPQDQLLKAKVLFNYSASECDNPEGNHVEGLKKIEQAYAIFVSFDEDFATRSLIRMAKAHLLLDHISMSQTILEKLKTKKVEMREQMHIDYLEAQILIHQHQFLKAYEVISRGYSLAYKLHAKADMDRFSQLMEKITNK